MRQRTIHALLLVVLAYVLTMTGQFWIGYRHVYSARPQAAALLHEAILRNQVPVGMTWEQLGASGTNLRRGSIVLAEGLRQASGLPLQSVYFALDTVFLFATLILLGVYLRRWLEPVWVALGLCFVGAVAPLTYLFYYFHPWDRLSQLLWLAALFFLRDRRFWPLAAALALAVWVKYDAVLLPLLWAMAVWPTGGRRAWVQTVALLVLAAGLLAGLKWLYPTEQRGQNLDLVARAGEMVQRTATELGERGFAFPPLLMFAVPLGLAAAGWRHLERYHRACVLFGCVLFVPFALASNLREVRAQVPILFLVLPAALLSGRRLLAQPSSSEAT